MKKTLIAVVMLLVVACGGPESRKGMTAGEEVIWMNDWMERHYGQMHEGDYEWEKYEVQAERVFEYMDSTIFAYHYPAVPDDLMEYFAGVPDDMVSVSQYHGDHAAARQEVATFWERIGMLQKYADGKSEYFPAEEIMTEVGHLLNTHLDLTSHSGYNAPEEYSYLVLAFRMVQQLVRLCPDIGMIADSMAVTVGTEFGIAGVQLCLDTVFLHHELAAEDEINFAIVHMGMDTHGLSGLQSQHRQHGGTAAQLLTGKQMAEQGLAFAAPDIGLEFCKLFGIFMDHCDSPTYDTCYRLECSLPGRAAPAP